MISPPIVLRWRACCASALLVFKRFGDDLVDRPETPDSFVAASYNALFRADEIGAALSEDFDVCNRRGVLPHLFRSSRGQAAVCASVVSTMDLKASWRNREQASLGCLRWPVLSDEIGVIGKFAMPRMPAHLLSKMLVGDGMTRQCLQSKRSNKLGHAGRHQDVYGTILLRQCEAF